MRYLSLCSGIEAATVAWHPMGWEPAAFAEIEAFPAAVLQHHYPNTPNLGDMTKWREWNVGAIDLLVGGTPCQSFSVAGLRKGLSDPRGGLMLTFLEIAQSLRPRWVVWENVPGVLSSAGGRDFGSFLGALGELGYGWAYRVLDAQWCRVDGFDRAVPQRRRRVFVVGCLGDATSAAKVLFERQSVERNPAPRGKARQGTAADAEGGVETGGWMPNNPGVVSSVCAKWAKKTGGPSGSEHFNLTMEPASKWPAEVYSTLNASFGEKQGLEDQHALGGAQCFVPAVAGTIDCDIPKQRVQNMAAGHWLAVPIHDKATRHEGKTGRGSGNGLGIGADGDPSPTLTSGDKHAVAMAVNVSNGEPRVADVMGTLDAARESRGTNQQRFIMEPFRKSHRAASATDDESRVRAETANTLNRFDTGERDTHAVAFTVDMQACKGNANIGDGSVSPTLCKPSGSDVHAIAFKPGQSAQARSLGAQDEVACTLEAGGGGNNRQAVAIDLYNQAIDGDCAATLTEACGGTNTSGPKVMQVAHTLRAEGHDASEDGTGRGVPLTVAFHPTQDPISSTDGTNHAMGCGSKQGTETVGVAYPIISDADRAESIAKTPSPDAEGRVRLRNPGLGIGMSNDPMFTLQATKPHSVATQMVAPSLTASNDPSRSPQSAEVTQQIAAVHQATMVVRRLTPVECERLQGFPDDYTNIPWRGKAESPDGPRYKALGNSMAVNCMRWIGRRIDAVEKGTELPA